MIAGGGIGGLAAALALHRRGWRVLVMERAAQLGEVGAGVTLMANGLRALDALAVGEAVRAAGSVEAPAVAVTPAPTGGVTPPAKPVVAQPDYTG